MKLAMQPLPLESSRWRTLNAHFANAGQDGDLPSVPSLLARWHNAVGTYREEYEYEDLRESYLHQQTLADVAYAVVPHLASRLAELDPDRCREILQDLAVVEEVRLLSPDQVAARIAAIAAAFPPEDDIEITARLRESFVQSARERLAPLPPDLAPAYLAAIAHADAAGGSCWREREDEADDADNAPQPRDWRRHVRYLRRVGWSDADIAFAISALRAPEADDGVALIYTRDRADARRALLRARRAPSGWLRRTRLRDPDGELAFLAVHKLAWWSLLDVDTMLGEDLGR